MKIFTFQGMTPADALKKARITAGEHAELIETKEIRKKSLHRSALYEIVVGVDEKYINSKDEEPEPVMPKMKKGQLSGYAPSNNSAESKSTKEVLLNISEAARQISAIANVEDVKEKHIEKDSTNEKSPEVEMEELRQIKGEISKLGDKVKLIQNMFWDDKVVQKEGLAIPPEFSEIYRIARQSGMNPDHLDKMMMHTLEHMPLKMRQNSETVKRYFQVLLRKMIPVRMEPLVSGPSKKVMMLVGSTGVGKTTSIAKLAARYSYLLDQKYKVGLIVLDTYRIGAVEQLMQYARMMKLGIETVVDPPEFSTALNSLRYCDYIFVDTMGSSPYDKKKIEAINQCLSNDTAGFEIDVILALQGTTKYEDMYEIYQKFSSLKIDTIMFTKLDETRSFGNIFSLIHTIQKPLSYFSIGQEVPEDLRVANGDFLIDCLLNGFDKDNA